MGKLPHVLVVPLPAQGHVMPLMKFSYQLVDHGVKVTFINIESVHKKVVSTLLDVEVVKPDNKIRLVAIPDKVINVEGEEKSIEFISETMAAHLENVINKINASDNEKIDYVVADACLGGILEVAEKFGIKGAAFWPASLGFLACMLHFPKLVEAGELDDNGNPMKDEDIILPPGMPAMSTIDYLWGLSDDPYMRKVMLAFIFNVNKATKVAKWMLCNSFCELEPASHEIIPKILTVGPLLASEKLGRPKGQLLPEDSTCLTWLDRQPTQSVIYAAFGSTTIFNQSQFNELVNALELINKPFLWVVRPGLTDELYTSILDGFKDRIGPLGKIIDWAPQQKVLAHPSIACFITHCGWNSTMEGVSNGVPLLCWPYVADQIHNENYICDILKVGLRFKKDENRIITRSEIQTKVQEVLRDEGIRSRAIKLKELAWKSIREGGSSAKNYEVFINSIKTAGMNIPSES